MDNAEKVDGNVDLGLIPQTPFYPPGPPIIFRDANGGPNPRRNRRRNKMELPDSPFDNTREGSDYLRLTNDCPPNGVLLQIQGVQKVMNDKFEKEEYNWSIIHFTPEPREKILTESSKGFCTAISKIATDMDELAMKILLVKWTKDEISRGRTIKYWNIKEATPDDLKDIQ